MRSVLFLVLAMMAWLAAPRAAQAAGCEGISNPFAYNECLSKQSAPKARSVSRGRGGDPEASVQERGGGRRARGVRGQGMGNGMVLTRSGGRVRATIDPWSGMRGQGTSKKRRR